MVSNPRRSRSHLVFDEPAATDLDGLAGGNLAVLHAVRRGRDAADDRIVDIVDDLLAAATDAGPTDPVERLCVVTSDRGLRARLAPGVDVEGAGAFRTRVGLGVR